MISSLILLHKSVRSIENEDIVLLLSAVNIECHSHRHKSAII